MNNRLNGQACILFIPCVTPGDHTERQETIEIRANTIAGAMPENIFQSVKAC